MPEISMMTCEQCGRTSTMTRDRSVCQECFDAARAAHASAEKTRRMQGFHAQVVQLLLSSGSLRQSDWPATMHTPNAMLRRELWRWVRDSETPKILRQLQLLLEGKSLALAGDVVDGAREWVTSSGWFFWFQPGDELVAALSPDKLYWSESDILRLLGCLPRVTS